MQTISFVGKIYGLQTSGTAGSTGFRANFRLGVRKNYVSEEDKKDGKVQVFVPMIAFGKTAEFINQYFEDGSVIAVRDCEYNTFESDKDGEKKYFHNFKVGNVSFIPTTEGAGESKSSSKSSKVQEKPSRRALIEDDEDEDYVPRRKATATATAGAGTRRRVVEDEEIPF